MLASPQQAQAGIGCILVAVLVVSVVLWVPPAAAAAILRVPEDHATVQAAVDAASAGDTIVISPGTYVGGVSIDESISLVAEQYDPVDPRGNAVVLDGGGGDLPVISVRRGLAPGPSITGLAIRNGSTGSDPRVP